MKTSATFSILHLILLSMTAIGLKNHVTILPPLLIGAGRDGWASVLLSALAALPWGVLLIYIVNRSNQASMRDWLTEQLGRTASKIVVYVLIFSLLFLAAVTMRETLQWVNTTFLPETPILPLLILYTIVCISLSVTNIQTIIILNAIVLFGVNVLGFFVAFTNIQVKEYELLLPLFEHGVQPILRGMVYPASGFIEILILFLFLRHRLDSRPRYVHFFIILFILTVLTLGPLIGAITEFGPDEAAKQRYPAYEEWGLVTLGRFIEHLDFLSIYQWLTGALVRVSVFLFIIADFLQITRQPVKIWQRIAPAFFFGCLALFLIDDHTFIDYQKKYFMPFTLIFFFALSLFLGIVAYISGKSTRRGTFGKRTGEDET
ncbi:endospore germination permease [Sporosarcina sp. FSL W7-1349]|uniref:GerAB/ArcD/ProY family transporter n=1 Tax=Bacillales TaxID=1385 RepID=UPI0005821BB9|nr:endospore germination permease [Bacillus sp. OxB-1]BAQ10250.1 spore germination protein xb [Bacillus sp. OxB-1]